MGHYIVGRVEIGSSFEHHTYCALQSSKYQQVIPKLFYRKILFWLLSRYFTDVKTFWMTSIGWMFYHVNTYKYYNSVIHKTLLSTTSDPTVLDYLIDLIVHYIYKFIYSLEGIIIVHDKLITLDTCNYLVPIYL